MQNLISVVYSQGMLLYVNSEEEDIDTSCIVWDNIQPVRGLDCIDYSNLPIFPHVNAVLTKVNPRANASYDYVRKAFHIHNFLTTVKTMDQPLDFSLKLSLTELSLRSLGR